MSPKHWSEVAMINIINALLGIALIASPWLFDFSGEQTATWSATLVGALVCLIALASLVDPQEWGAWESLVAGLWAAVAPWVLGFAGDTYAVWSHLGVGLASAVLAAIELWRVHGKPGKLALRTERKASGTIARSRNGES